jgi:hypothetical protein
VSNKRKRSERQHQPRIDVAAVTTIFADSTRQTLEEILNGLSTSVRQTVASRHVSGPDIDLPQSMLDKSRITLGTIEKLYTDTIERYRELHQAATSNNDPEKIKTLTMECMALLSVILINNYSPEVELRIANHFSQLQMILHP